MRRDKETVSLICIAVVYSQAAIRHASPTARAPLVAASTTKIWYSIGVVDFFVFQKI